MSKIPTGTAQTQQRSGLRSKLDELITKIDFSHYSYRVENLIARATKKADHIVEAAVDLLKTERPDKFPGDTWSKIQSARADRIGRFNGHRFIYEWE